MARVAMVNLVDFDIVEGIGVASYKLVVLRTGADSPRNPIPELDEYSLSVPVSSLDTMDAAMMTAATTAAAATGLQEAEIITKGRPRNPWLSPPSAGGGGPLCVVWHGDASANFAMTNATAAEQFPVNQPQRVVKDLDLTGMGKVRMVGYVSVASNSPGAPKVSLKYKTGAYSGTVGQYSAIGTSAVEFSLSAIGPVNTGWVDLAEAAKGPIQCGITTQGGDGVLDPALGYLHVFFKP